jgi:hypothetical protein
MRRSKRPSLPNDATKNEKGSNVFAITLAISLACMALSAGFYSRLDAFTPDATVIGLQILFSAGFSLGSYQIGHFITRWTSSLLSKNEDGTKTASYTPTGHMHGGDRRFIRHNCGPGRPCLPVVKANTKARSGFIANLDGWAYQLPG